MCNITREKNPIILPVHYATGRIPYYHHARSDVTYTGEHGTDTWRGVMLPTQVNMLQTHGSNPDKDRTCRFVTFRKVYIILSVYIWMGMGMGMGIMTGRMRMF